jgi:hypothetical protein
MLPRNFAHLASAEPRLRGVFSALDRWVESHRTWPWLVPGIVARDLPTLDAFDLADALGAAVRQGLLRVAYTVLTPSGVLADQSFESPSSIPRLIPDRHEHYFETGSLPIVPIYTGIQGSGPNKMSECGQGAS